MSLRLGRSPGVEACWWVVTDADPTVSSAITAAIRPGTMKLGFSCCFGDEDHCRERHPDIPRPVTRQMPMTRKSEKSWPIRSPKMRPTARPQQPNGKNNPPHATTSDGRAVVEHRRTSIPPRYGDRERFVQRPNHHAVARRQDKILAGDAAADARTNTAIVPAAPR